MKEVLGNLWFTKDATNDSTNIGFTKAFIDERLSECFHVLMADTKVVKEKGPLLVLETNDGLEPVRSPLGGRIIFFNDKARNFPDRLLESDIIVSLSHKEPVKKVAQTPYYDMQMLQAQFNAGLNLGQGIAQAPAARPARLVRQEEPEVPHREGWMTDGAWQATVAQWSTAVRAVRAHNREVQRQEIVVQQAQAQVAELRRANAVQVDHWPDVGQ